MRSIHTSGAPSAIGPYSQAVYQKGHLYVSGQLGIDINTGELGTTFESQVENIFTSLRNILSAANMTFSNVLKVSIFMEDMKNFEALNNLYSRYFSDPYPARETFQVCQLPLNAAVEISVIASD